MPSSDRPDVMPDQQRGAASAEIVGVFVGRPRVIGDVGGRPVDSAIGKAPVDAARLALGRTNLDGDRQADLTVHGGPDKAVYAYPAAHYPRWRDDGFAVDPGGLGENVTLDGVVETQLHLGDLWRWGEALLQVSQPRSPCFKLALHTGRRDIGPRMLATGRSGWYLRVVETGTVPTAGTFTLVDRDDVAPTIAETFAVMSAPGGHDPDAPDRALVDRVVAHPALADGWRAPLLARRGRERS